LSTPTSKAALAPAEKDDEPATRLSRRTAIGALATVLASCGFELRRAPEFRFRTVQLVGFSSKSPLAQELRSTIDASPTTKVVDAVAQPQVVLEALTDAREKSVVASTAVGQVTEFTLRARFRFRLRTIAGKELIGPTEIVQSRDLSYTESAALGKELEEASLYRAMQTDIVSQVMRRLASVPQV
jgi:LPS-assembly lipoprotein